MEDLLDQAYELFFSKEGSAMLPLRKCARRTNSKDINLLESGGDEINQSDYDSDRHDTSDQEANSLVVPLSLTHEEEITNKWFSQDIFAEAAEW
ncbi:hypothetical protein L484_020310 [Morus notabilis]|uniref:Uncharacterized protein n=1 Tax=Morus notabilis TaxID=981085 RepID=W9QH76_9ROSA|nr:hypothetical protein L484_020310 [Morus notabilis]